jgi:DNA-directed RNA polymerase subunit RPC12/RpoP
MNIGTFFGYKCPRCGSKVNVGVGEPVCSNCGVPMVPDPEGASTGVNIVCNHCGTSAGMISGFDGNCPTCGRKIA